MKKIFISLLGVLMCSFITGCDHDEYEYNIINSYNNNNNCNNNNSNDSTSNNKNENNNNNKSNTSATVGFGVDDVAGG